MILQVNTQRSGPDVIVPERAHESDAGHDLRAAESFTMGPGDRKLIRTGLSIAIPEGYAGLVLPRSGLAIQEGITVLNAPGLIDSGYRGEVMVALIHHGGGRILFNAGERIAQLIFVKCERAEFVHAVELDVTERNGNGFGSTGV